MTPPDEFLDWLRGRSAAAGHDLSVRGGLASLARAADLDSGLLSRVLGGTVEPGVPTQRALAKAVGVSLREMLIRSGTATAAELDAETPSRELIDLRQVALARGVPANRADQAVVSAYAVLDSFRTDA